jgi:hypothetical protein
MVLEFEKKAKRGYVVSMIGDMKTEQKSFGEGFCLYVKSVQLLQKAIEFARQITDSIVQEELRSSFEKCNLLRTFINIFSV